MNILKFKNDVIPYTVNKAVSGALCICVDGNEVVVNAPWYVSKKHIQEVINEKKQWIISKIEKYNQNQNIYSNKGVISLLGNEYPVCVFYKNSVAPTINLENGKVEVILPTKYKKIEDSKILQILMEKIYFKVCNNELERAMEKGFYEGVNLSLAYCNNCGHEELDMDTWPQCGSDDLTKIDRMNGYLSYSRVHGDTRLNKAKMAEIAERKSM